MRRSKPLELVMAWREARASLSKFQFVMAAIALGVGALVGVRLFSQAFRDALLREARTLLAADLSVRMSVLPTEEERRVLAGLERRGAESTWTTETVSMVSTLDASRMILTAVKAVEPGRYPFYGRIELQPTGSLRSLLDVHSTVVSRDLLVRLGAEVGDAIRVGAGEFRIAAVLHREPDRMASGFMANLGPRLLLSRTALDRSGLVQHGSRAQHRFLLRLTPRAPPMEAVRQTLEQGFGRRGSVSDFRQGDRRISRTLNRATTFLSLVSLLALLVGGLGVATAIHTHLQQRLDTVAILKCLGGRSLQIARIYLAQAALLALGGSLAGVALGYLVRALFPLFIADSVSLPTRMQWAPAIAFQGLAVGLLTALLFTLPPLLAVSRVRPALVFRRDMAEARPTWRVRLRTNAPSNLAAVAILAAIGLVASWLAGSLRLGFLFVAVLAGSVLAMGSVAWALLRVLRSLPAALPWKLPVPLRLGLANLHRPGSHASGVLVALGIGATFTLTAYLLQTSLLDQLISTAPPGMPNVYLINVTDREREPLWKFLRPWPGVEDAADPIPAVAGQLTRINGRPIEEVRWEEGVRWMSRAQFSLTWAERVPRATTLVQGSWWPAQRPAENLVSVSEGGAEALKVKPGDTLEWSVGGQPLQARVANVRRTEDAWVGSNNVFIFSPGALDHFPAAYYGAIRVRAAAIASLQQSAFQRFPTVTVINASDVLETVQQVVDRIALAVRFTSSFAILAGLGVLASSVAVTRFRRLREIVILRTLGATQSRALRILSVEFLVLGAAAGLVAGLLANAFAAYLLGHLLETEYRFRWGPWLAAVPTTAALAILTGRLACRGLLRPKPLEVLREE